MSFGSLPVTPTGTEVPLVPVNKWVKSDGVMTKTYQFRLPEQRNAFVKQLLDHELEVQHSAVMTVEEETVTLKLQTKDVRQVTELDKEYGKWADALFKDVVMT